MVRVPRIVDHDQRRAEIVRGAWRLIARKGIEATTMRQLAEELGYANGALSLYFPNKRAILTAVFTHVFAATNERFAASGAGLRGEAALRAFLQEVFPFDEERLLEARIVIPFLEYAAHDAGMRELYDRHMAQWRSELARLLDEMTAEGERAPELDVTAAIDHIIAVTVGVQATGVLLPATTEPVRLRAALDSLLRSLR